MNLKLKHAAQAWVFAALFFLQDYNTLLAPSGERRMISSAPVTPIVLSHLAQIALLALLFAGVVALLRKFTPWRSTQWFVIVLTVVVLAGRLRPLLTFLPHTNFTHLRPILLLLLLLCVFFAVKKFPRELLRLKEFAGTVFAAFVVFAILISGELLRLVFWHPGIQQFSHAVSAPENPDRPRLVWIVFDELDYYQTFGHRDPTLQLPNFDRLRSQSILYTDVPPVKPRTLLAVPSFLSGSVVNSIEYTWNNRLLVKTDRDPSLHPFDPEDTVFGAARHAGLRSAIVGWAIPYCPIFAKVVDQCYWTNRDASPDGPSIAVQDSFLHDLWSLPHFMLDSAFAPRKAIAFAWRDMATDHNLSVQDLTSHALQAIRDSHADVLYFHLPVPHPPSSYNRFTHQFAVGGSYLDSLAQADDVLGKLLNALQSQPRWQHTTVIVQGDHGWRHWESYPGNTEERRLMLAHPMDIHPAVLVHHAGQTAPETVSTPASLLGLKGVALAAIRQAKP